MLNSKFLRNKVNRQIKLNGQEFTFVRYKEDEYHQISEEEKEEIYVEGIFHTTNSFVKANTSDASIVRTKSQPMILTLYEQGSLVKINDKVVINEETYKVIDVNNVNSFNEVCDISLEIER